MLTAIYSCKIKNVSPNFEGSAFQSDLDSFLSICNDYLQETANNIPTRVSVKANNTFKMIDIIVYIKCGLLLKVIANEDFLQFFSTLFLLEAHKSKMLFVPLVMLNN